MHDILQFASQIRNAASPSYRRGALWWLQYLSGFQHYVIAGQELSTECQWLTSIYGSSPIAFFRIYPNQTTADNSNTSESGTDPMCLLSNLPDFT